MDIWYHDDLDGVVSAALLTTALREEFTPQTNMTAIPVNYGQPLPKPGPLLAVVDFLFHPQAMIWFDHHPTAFANDNHAKQVAEAQHPWWVHNPAVGSCARLIGTTLGERGLYPPALVEWEELAHQVDTATYTSPMDYIELRDTGAALAQIYNALGTADRAAWVSIVPYLTPEGLLRRHRTTRDALQDANRQALGQFESVAKCTNSVVHADLTTSSTPWVRFAGFATYPKAKAMVTLGGSTETGYRLNVSANPWTMEVVPHVGLLMRSFGGGGHARAAGASFTQYPDAVKAYWHTVREL